MATFTTAFALRSAVPILVPLAADIAPSLGSSGSTVYASYGAHWSGFSSSLGRTPTIYGAPANSVSQDPSQWSQSAQALINSLPASAMATGSIPLLTFAPQDSTGNSIYPGIAAGSSTIYSGQTIDFWIQQMLSVFLAAGILQLYIRMGAGWNVSTSPWAITAPLLPSFIGAHQHFGTLCHNFATANGMSIKVVWSPAIGSDNGISLAAQFPNKNVGDKFVDVVGPTSYAEAANLTSDTTNSVSLCLTTSCVALAQQWALPIALSELGGLTHASVSAATTWIPNCVNYFGSIGPTLPIEFLCLYDADTALGTETDIEWSNATLLHSDITTAWKAGFLVTGVTPIFTTTTRPIMTNSVANASGFAIALGAAKQISNVAAKGTAVGTSTAAGVGSFNGVLITAPPQAAAAGFHSLVFNDDFTTNTLAPAVNTPYSSLYNWYWSINGALTDAVVAPTLTAATVANGNVGAGTNASPLGGILQITKNKFGNSEDAVLASIQGTTNTLPTLGQGNWQHAYFEAYIQTQTGSPSGLGWGRFAASTTSALASFGYTSTLNSTTFTDIRFFEFYGLNFGYTATAEGGGFSMFNTSAGTTTLTAPPGGLNKSYDSNWHTIGCLWTSTGVGTGQVSFYYDNVLTEGPFATGTGAPTVNLENDNLFLNLSCANNWPFNVDWVRVWQAP